MPGEKVPYTTQEFLTVAQSQSLLTPEVADAVSRDAEAQGLTASQLLLERGTLDPVQIDMVDTLLRAGEAFPGYEILEVLGRGGMGVVYRARQKNLNREVAIKTIFCGGMNQSALTARFEKEAIAVAGLRHPNIVLAHDFGRQGERLYFVMELLEGEDLERRMARAGPLKEAAAWGIARQAAWGLAHAAEKGIVHRDVKPANLLLVEPPAGSGLPPGLPMVKIADFGLMLRSGEEAAPRLTMAGTSLGTPAYMAPEQIGNPAVDCRADIYALGATVYHMISGRPPFAGETVWQTMSLKMKGEMPPLEGLVSAPSADLIRDMLALDPANRVQSYPELLKRIDRASSFATAPTDVLVSKPPAPPRKLSKAWILGTCAVVTICMASLAGWWFAHRGSEPLAPPQLTSGPIVPLFAGTLQGWQPVQGSWAVATDEELARVLAGSGTIIRRLNQTENFRVSLAVGLHEATAVELQFALGERNGEKQARYGLHLTKDTAMLGKRDSDGGTFQELQTVAMRALSSETSPYRELKIERHGKRWWAYAGGNLLGALPADPKHELPEIRLVTEGGPAFFDAVEMSSLVETTVPQQQ
jgi:serine/threonine protein kinase